MTHKFSAAKAAQFPVGECFLPDSLFETGMGIVVLTRKTPDGGIAVASFLLDVFCLGCKDAMYRVFTPTGFAKYIQQVKQISSYKNIHPCCARKLVEGAVAYAHNFGLAPHSDYAVAAQLFGDIDAAACPVAYTYGKNGKPFYISGPYESPAQSRKILETLARTLGPGKYDYLAETGIVDKQRPEQSLQLNYAVVDEQVVSPAFKKLPQAIKDELVDIYHHKLYSHPEQAVDILKPILEQYPNVPQIHNFLQSAYELMGDKTAAQNTFDVMVQRFPDYLPVKIKLIEDCLISGKLDEVPRILDGKYDLKLLYPRRNKFHVSEFAGFNSMLAWYFYELGDLERAKMYYAMLNKFAPNDKKTQIVKKKLFPSPFGRLVSKFMSWNKH